MADSNAVRPEGVSRSLVLVLALAGGAVVANLYYSQPLLAEIARAIGISESRAGLIPALTQMGYGLGLLFLIPLGDKAERRRLIVTLVLLAAVALLFTGGANSALLLFALNLVVGLLSVVPQIIVPFVATLSGPADRNRNVGTVMSGLLIGILLARTASGFLGEHLGWRFVYFIAAGVMVVLAVLLRIMLPASREETGASYFALMRSIPGLLRKLPVLGEAAVNGALIFGVFSVFWSTLVFKLEALPAHFGAQTAGLFGLVGASGALAANLSGRLADRMGPCRIVRIGCTVVFGSWAVMWLGGGSVWALACGAVLLDFGIQASHVANQALIFAQMPEARSRINTVYMVTFFTGGAIGSLAGSYTWKQAGWTGVCVLGAALMVIALAASFLMEARRESAWARL